MMTRHYPAWFGILIPAALIAVWAFAGAVHALPTYLPPLDVIFGKAAEMLSSGELFKHAVISLYRAMAGFLIGSFFGVLMGLLAAAYRPIDGFYEPLISLTYPVPKIAALPIIFAWFGLGNLSKIVVIFISVFYPVYIAANAGGKSTPRVLLWASQNMGASKFMMLWRVLLPAALPQIFNGLRIGLALSFVVMFVAELVSSNEGLGYLVAFSEQNNRFDIMYVAVLTTALLGLAGDACLTALGRRLLVGQHAGRGR